MNNDDGYLYYADIGNIANGKMTTFQHDGECLLYIIFNQCKDQVLLYHVNRQKKWDDNYKFYNKIVYHINRDTTNKDGQY